tara:strand:- start:73 stop:408 length:336 start_codon:yes stop_codon:yes gene_type:complete
MNSTEKKLVSFRLEGEMIEALNTASRITGQNKTDLIVACVSAHLPALISAVKLDDHVKSAAKEARIQASNDVKLVEELLAGKLAQNPVDEGATEALKLADEQIRKKRKKKK